MKQPNVQDQKEGSRGSRTKGLFGLLVMKDGLGGSKAKITRYT